MTATYTTGTMGSGKSKTLIEKFNEDEKIAFAFSASFEKKTGEKGIISSRNGSSLESIVLNPNEPEKSIEIVKGYLNEIGVDSVYIDEIQFLNESVLSNILVEIVKLNVDVHFFGLETTFTGEKFEGAKYLLNAIDPDKIYRIEMCCQRDGCKKSASYNGRIIDGKIVREGKTFVEAKSQYLAFCKSHFFE